MELRPVDDEMVQPQPVVRLLKRQIVPHQPEEEPVRRLGKAAPKEPSRLEIPTREDLELRSHQPGIEALIEPDVINPDLVEENWGEAAKRNYPVPWGWFVLLGIALVAAAIWSLGHMESADLEAERIRTQTRALLTEDERKEQEARETVERIELALRVYFSANSVDSLARLVRQHDRVLPLMRAYHQQHPLTVSPLKTVRVLQPLTLDKRGNFWMASVILTDNQLRNLIIEIDPSGNPLIDWETLVCHQPMAWDDYASQRPNGTTMDFRVYAQPDVFFSHEFADSKKWHCFRLTALDSEETLFGYIAIDAPEARTLLDLIQMNGNQRTSLILRLSIPHGLKSRRGVVIDKVVSPRWLYLDPPADST